MHKLQLQDEAEHAYLGQWSIRIIQNRDKEICNLQLVPPDTPCWNLAERAIQTFKSHFITILAGVNSSFPMSLWDRLVPQAVITLNLLRQANKMPSVSVYEFVNGKFDYNKFPLAPLYCAVEMHESTNRQKTWDLHSLSGWYLGTSTEHTAATKLSARRRVVRGYLTRYSFGIGT